MKFFLNLYMCVHICRCVCIYLIIYCLVLSGSMCTSVADCIFLLASD